MYKGLVYQISGSFIIVHCDDGRYLKLKKKNNLEIGSYIAFFDKDIIKPNTKRVMSVLSVAALVLIAFFIQPYLYPTRDVYAIVGIDSESSVEYAVDSEGNVIEMNAFNDKGEEILNDNYIGMSISEVINKSVNRALELGFASDEDILISETLVSDGSYIISNEALDLLAENHSLENLYMIRPNADMLKEAEKNNVSVARMFLANKIAETTNKAVEAVLEESLTDMLNELDESLEELKKIDKVIEDATDEVHNALDKVKDQVKKLEKLPFVNDAMKEVSDELDDLDKKLDEIESELPSVEKIIEDVKSEIKNSFESDD